MAQDVGAALSTYPAPRTPGKPLQLRTSWCALERNSFSHAVVAGGAEGKRFQSSIAEGGGLSPLYQFLTWL